MQLESQVSLYDAARISMQLTAAHTTHRGSTTNAKNIFWWSIPESPEQLKEVVATCFFLSDGSFLKFEIELSLSTEEKVPQTLAKIVLKKCC